MLGPDVEALQVDIEIPRSPEEVQAWWTGIDEVYVAQDPREHPHRIEVLEHRPDGALLATYWRGPLGKEIRNKEELTIVDDGHWTFDHDSLGFHIHDDLHLVPTEEGCRLDIEVTITHSSVLSKLARRLVLQGWKERFRETFEIAAEICQQETAAFETPPTV